MLMLNFLKCNKFTRRPFGKMWMLNVLSTMNYPSQVALLLLLLLRCEMPIVFWLRDSASTKFRVILMRRLTQVRERERIKGGQPGV